MSKYVSFPVALRDIFTRLLSVMAFWPWYHVISGTGCASKTHSIINTSPSCRIVGFFGKRGGLPSGILYKSTRQIRGSTLRYAMVESAPEIFSFFADFFARVPWLVASLGRDIIVIIFCVRSIRSATTLH